MVDGDDDDNEEDSIVEESDESGDANQQLSSVSVSEFLMNGEVQEEWEEQEIESSLLDAVQAEGEDYPDLNLVGGDQADRHEVENYTFNSDVKEELFGGGNQIEEQSNGDQLGEQLAISDLMDIEE